MFSMALVIQIVVVLLVAGILWWAIQQIPLPSIVKVVANVILALILCGWLLHTFGIAA